MMLHWTACAAPLQLTMCFERRSCTPAAYGRSATVCMPTWHLQVGACGNGDADCNPIAASRRTSGAADAGAAPDEQKREAEASLFHHTCHSAFVAPPAQADCRCDHDGTGDDADPQVRGGQYVE